jgi:hypothetical protein
MPTWPKETGSADEIKIARLADAHIDRLRELVDIMARERKYLAIVEADPPKKFREDVRKKLANGDTFLVAVAGRQIVGWCEIYRFDIPSLEHRWALDDCG